MWEKIIIPMYSYDYMACMDYMDLSVRCSRKTFKLNHRLTQHSLWMASNQAQARYVPGQ